MMKNSKKLSFKFQFARPSQPRPSLQQKTEAVAVVSNYQVLLASESVSATNR
jgi:hypothetical protein